MPGKPRRTIPGTTRTDGGPVPHLRWRGLSLPVAVEQLGTEGNLPSVKLCPRGFPMYVLPGGAQLSARELQR